MKQYESVTDFNEAPHSTFVNRTWNFDSIGLKFNKTKVNATNFILIMNENFWKSKQTEEKYLMTFWFWLENFQPDLAGQGDLMMKFIVVMVNCWKFGFLIARHTFLIWSKILVKSKMFTWFFMNCYKWILLLLTLSRTNASEGQRGQPCSRTRDKVQQLSHRNFDWKLRAYIQESAGENVGLCVSSTTSRAFLSLNSFQISKPLGRDNQHSVRHSRGHRITIITATHQPPTRIIRNRLELVTVRFSSRLLWLFTL